MRSSLKHSVSPIDENHLLYGNFIGLQYIFEKGLDVAALKKAIDLLTSQFPALSGRYQASSSGIKPSKKAAPLNIYRSPKSIAEIIHAPERPNALHQPKRRSVLRGRAPLSTFTLTEFEDGGMILGIAISHVLTDAAGFHLLIRHLSEIYTAILSKKTPPEFPFTAHLDVFEFGTGQSKQASLTRLAQRGLPKPLPIKGLLGGFIKALIIKAMDKSVQDNPPIRLLFSPKHITQLKQSVLSKSGEDWISTNTALCAHFTSIIAKLSYGDNLKPEMQIGQLLDLRGRYFKDNIQAQSRYIGNAILIHIDKAEFPEGLQKTSRGALARYFKDRQSKTTPQDIQDKLNLLADCLRHGFTNPELDVKNPIISLNNQSKMPVYDIDFGRQTPLRIIPQDVGDNIMFFPAPNGGIEIYIRDIVNPLRQRDLLTPKWQKQIFDF